LAESAVRSAVRSAPLPVRAILRKALQ
jgi:hypothetical protein